MAKKRRDIGNPKELYEACKQWAEDETHCFAEPANLAQVWHRAVQQDVNGRTFRQHVLRNYAEAKAWREYWFNGGFEADWAR